MVRSQEVCVGWGTSMSKLLQFLSKAACCREEVGGGGLEGERLRSGSAAEVGGGEAGSPACTPVDVRP